MKLDQINAVITGATGGIGRSFAQHLTKAGARVMLVGRDEDALKKLQQDLFTQTVVKPNQVHFFCCDLLKSEEREALVKYIESFQWPINTLINNAGDNQFGLLEKLSESRIEKIIQLNTVIPMLLSRGLITPKSSTLVLLLAASATRDTALIVPVNMHCVDFQKLCAASYLTALFVLNTCHRAPLEPA